MRCIALPILAVVALSGCAQLKTSMSDYQEPVGGDMAMIRFSTNGELIVFPDRNCEDWSAPGAGVVIKHQFLGKGKYSGQMLGMTGTAPTGFTSGEIRVPAKPLTVNFKSEIQDGSWIYTCQGSFTFLPRAGEQYQVTVRHDQAARMCRSEPTSLLNPSQRVSLYKTQACK